MTSILLKQSWKYLVTHFISCSSGQLFAWCGTQRGIRIRIDHFLICWRVCRRNCSNLSTGTPVKCSNQIVQLKLSAFFLMCLQVRKHIYHDADNLDTAFDAGGKVSIGLTATTIVSQWTWSATLLQSSTVASKVKNSWKIPLPIGSLVFFLKNG